LSNKPIFKQGKETTGKRPNTLISDGPRNFNDAFNKEFYTNTTQEHGISDISVYKETTITTRWSVSMERLQTGRK
jgi:hypothetical protein